MANRTYHPYHDPPALGTRFGRWVTIGDQYTRSPKNCYVPCRCDCGTERDVSIGNLRKSLSRSCGCWGREKTTARNFKHGYTRTERALYHLWAGIKRRCYDPKVSNYRWYGERGIGMWEDWREDPAAFIEYVLQEIGPRPEGFWIDRVDNNGNYAPGNLRWATPSEQITNSRHVRGEDGRWLKPRPAARPSGSLDGATRDIVCPSRGFQCPVAPFQKSRLPSILASPGGDGSCRIAARR